MAQELKRYPTPEPGESDPTGATGRTNRRFPIISMSLVAIIALLVGVVFLIGPSSLGIGNGIGSILSQVIFSVSEDTEYATGYSKRAFRKIAIGDTEARVHEALGTPLSESSAEPQVRWLYSPKPVPEFGLDGSYPDIRHSFTTITFGDDGIFDSAFGQISGGSSTSLLVSSASATMGDGVNTLSLTKADIDKLKSEKATPEQIEAKFGKPRAVFESRATKWLRYSHSPGSTHYRQQIIGIDRNGKVYRKVNETYWD